MSFDVCSEANIEGLHRLQHSSAIALDYTDIQDNSGFGDICDVFTNIELSQLFGTKQRPHWWANVFHRADVELFEQSEFAVEDWLKISGKALYYDILPYTRLIRATEKFAD